MAEDEEPHLPNAVLPPPPASSWTKTRDKDSLLPRAVCSGCACGRVGCRCRWSKVLAELSEEHERGLAELRKENAELRQSLGCGRTSAAAGSRQLPAAPVLPIEGADCREPELQPLPPKLGQSKYACRNEGKTKVHPEGEVSPLCRPTLQPTQLPIHPRGRPPYMACGEDAPFAPQVNLSQLESDVEAFETDDLDASATPQVPFAIAETAQSLRNRAEVEQPYVSRDKSELSEVELKSPRWMQDWQRRLMDVFEQIDTDCSGTIDISEMKRVFEAAKLPVEQAQQFINEVDVSGDGVVDRAEWLHMLENAAQEDAPEWLMSFSQTLAKIQAKNGRIYPQETAPKPNFIIRQDSAFRITWDLLLTCFLFYISLMLPFALGFGSTPARDQIDNVIDYLFLLDVCLNFRTSFTDRDDQMVLNGKRIAVNYLKTWCFLDLISSLPFDQLSSGLMPRMQAAKLLKVGKIMKVFKMLRLGKLKKTMDSEVFDELQDKLFTKSNQLLFKVGRLLVLMLILSHWLACFMGVSGTEWYYGNREEANKYLSAMYWAMTTLTTVGYGDITPIGDAELMYAVIAMVVGGSFYGYIVGKISASISSLDLNAQSYYDRMEHVNTWLDYHTELPRSLRRRVRNHFKTILTAKAAVPDSMILDDLTPALIHDVAFFLVQDEVRCNNLFRDLPDSALSMLMPILVKTSFDRGERVVARGEPGTAMYIIIEGTGRFEQGHQWKQPPKEEQKDDDKGAAPSNHLLQIGDSFGEEIMLQLEETYQYTVVSATKTTMFHISEKAFADRFGLFPDVKKHMVNNFMQNREPEEKIKPSSMAVGNELPDGFADTVLKSLKEINRHFRKAESKLEPLDASLVLDESRRDLLSSHDEVVEYDGGVSDLNTVRQMS